MLRDLVMEFNLNNIDTKQYYTNKIKNEALMSKPFGTITLDLESMAQEASVLEYKKTETKKLHKKLKKIKEQEKSQREREKPSIF
jgi:flagellar basal body rod protein FlgB